MNWMLKKIAMTTQRFMNKINNLTALYSGALVFLYMFLVTANIVGRFFFNAPIAGTMEIGQLVLAVAIFFNLAYAQMEKAHIRVTFVIEKFPAKLHRKIETAILLIGFLVMVLMAWRSVPFALESFHIREAHMSVDVPIWPIKFIFLCGWALLGLQFFSEFINEIASSPSIKKNQQS